MESFIGSESKSSQQLESAYWDTCRKQRVPAIVVRHRRKYGTLVVSLEPIYPLRVTDEVADLVAGIIRKHSDTKAQITWSDQNWWSDRIPFEEVAAVTEAIALVLQEHLPTGYAAAIAIHTIWTRPEAAEELARKEFPE